MPKTTNPPTSKSEQTKNKIYSAAAELFGKNGYHETTVKEICALAEISNATFFNHFSSKANMLSAHRFSFNELTASGINDCPEDLQLKDTLIFLLKEEAKNNTEGIGELRKLRQFYCFCEPGYQFPQISNRLHELYGRILSSKCPWLTCGDAQKLATLLTRLFFGTLNEFESKQDSSFDFEEELLSQLELVWSGIESLVEKPN